MKKVLPYLLIAVLTLALILSMRGCFQRTVQEHRMIQAATVGPDSGRLWKDAYDREHRRAEAVTVDYKTMRLVYGAMLDSVAILNGVRRKQLESITWLTTEVRGYRALSAAMQPATGDHVPFTLKQSDAWSSFELSANIYHCDSVADAGMHYYVRDSSILTGQRKRAYHIGRLQFGNWTTRQVDAVSFNPDVHYTGQRSYRILDKPTRWGIGFQLGVTYDGQQPRGYVGFGFSHNVIRF